MTEVPISQHDHNMINSRPLTRNSNDHSDDILITPNHLLQSPYPTLPPGLKKVIFMQSVPGDKRNTWRRCFGVRGLASTSQLSWNGRSGTLREGISVLVILFCITTREVIGPWLE